MSATPASVDREGGGVIGIIGESVAFAYARGVPPYLVRRGPTPGAVARRMRASQRLKAVARSRFASMAYHEGTKKHEDPEE